MLINTSSPMTGSLDRNTRSCHEPGKSSAGSAFELTAAARPTLATVYDSKPYFSANTPAGPEAASTTRSGKSMSVTMTETVPGA